MGMLCRLLRHLELTLLLVSIFWRKFGAPSAFLYKSAAAASQAGAVHWSLFYCHDPTLLSVTLSTERGLSSRHCTSTGSAGIASGDHTPSMVTVSTTVSPPVCSMQHRAA